MSLRTNEKNEEDNDATEFHWPGGSLAPQLVMSGVRPPRALVRALSSIGRESAAAAASGARRAGGRKSQRRSG